MVATRDIGPLAAELLQRKTSGTRVVELDGAERTSPNELAATSARALGRSVTADVVPRDTWMAPFTTQGMKNPTPRVQMIDGFNEGWICLESNGADVPQVQLHWIL